MPFKCGIVGLPNVGKSTFFNAISKTSLAQSANYPFCTIEPNSSIVAIHDKRLNQLAKIANSQEIIPNSIEIYDIAGLVKGASKGEGLGNKFLSHIREVDAIIHLVRSFEDGDIIHVEQTVNPIRDIEIINTELILADLEQIENQIARLEKRVKSGNDKKAMITYEICKAVKTILENGQPASSLDLSSQSDEYTREYKLLNLITSKPVLFVANVDEESLIKGNNLSNTVKDYANTNRSGFAIISAKIEAEISNLESEEERVNFIEMLGLAESGLDRVSRTVFDMLNLISYFTVGPKEAHAWQIPQGTKAPQAAGVIHTDFERGFIKAEVISFDDYIKYNGEQGAKENGKLRLEGKEYIINDGDIVHFKFNV